MATMGVVRTICYRGFCDVCMHVVSAAPRLDEADAANDLRAHRNIVHADDQKSTDSELPEWYTVLDATDRAKADRLIEAQDPKASDLGSVPN